MAKPKIFFDTLPSCGACKVMLPVVEKVANENNAELFLMDSRELHGNQTTFLPTIYVFDGNGNETVLDGTSTVGDLERALGKRTNFLDTINFSMNDYFNGVVEIAEDGTLIPVEYESEKEPISILNILIVFIVFSLVVWLSAKYLLK